MLSSKKNEKDLQSAEIEYEISRLAEQERRSQQELESDYNNSEGRWTE
jgi:hypothetical protein